MKWKIALALLLIAALFAAPAVAADSFEPEEKSNNKDKDKDKDKDKENKDLWKEIGKIKKFLVHHDVEITDASAEIDALSTDTAKSSKEKLAEYSALFGYDDRLAYYMEVGGVDTLAETAEDENGNPILDYIGDIFDALFGESKKAPENPYTEAEGDAAWNNYYASYVDGYQATGEFGGPIQ